MTKWFLDFEAWIEKHYGYEFVVHLEDSILGIACVFLGMLIMGVLCGRVIFRLTKQENLGNKKVQLTRFKQDGTTYAVADPKNIGEAIETLLLIIFMPLFRNRKYDKRDERRTKIFLVFLTLLGIALLILAVLSVSTVTIDNY